MPARLSIGDVADRSGVPAATLRSWEARYGFPNRTGWPAAIGAMPSTTSNSWGRSSVTEQTA